MRRALARFAAFMLTAATMLAASPLAADAAEPTWRSGAFTGHGPSGLAAFGEWRGSAVRSSTDFVAWDSWDLMKNPQWQIAAWKPVAATTQLTLSYPMWPNTGGSLAEGASGAYNDHWKTLARNLVANGMSKTVLRIGWEFNGNWYPWSVKDATDGANFAKYWRSIVTAMRSVRGQAFAFDWTPTATGGGIDPAIAYPGDAYVSYIGLDVYDWGWPGATASQRWDALVNNGYGLKWQADFAAAHNKKLSFPEWGLTYAAYAPDWSGGDAPTFVQNMYDWFATHNVAYENYFNSDTTYGLYYGVTTGNDKFPNAAASYQALY